MTLHEFQKLLTIHLEPKRAREIMRIYLEVSGEPIDQEYEIQHQLPEGMTYEEYLKIKDSLQSVDSTLKWRKIP